MRLLMCLSVSELIILSMHQLSRFLPSTGLILHDRIPNWDVVASWAELVLFSFMTS